MEIYIIHDHTFIISLLFIVHDKIIMFIETWRTTRENSATTMAVRRGVSALELPRNYSGFFLKLVELCKGLVVLPCLACLVEVYEKSRSLGRCVT
jgi:predicted ferric reductase